MLVASPVQRLVLHESAAKAAQEAMAAKVPFAALAEQGGAHHKVLYEPSRAHQVVEEQLESESDQEQVRRMVPAAVMAAAMAAAA